MNITIQRLFHGYATIRDYQAREAYYRNEDLVIVLGKKQMRIPRERIITEVTENPRIYESIHEKGLKYKLWDYVWKPTAEQEALL